MLATIASATLLGVQGRPVTVEVHVAAGLPAFTIVGLPDASCREARDRVRAALLSSGLPWPQTRVTVNLAPSSERKEGAGLDLAIAVGVLVAQGELEPAQVGRRAFLGELGLDGAVRPVPGIVPLVDAVGADEVVVAAACAADAGLIGRHLVRAAYNVRDVVEALAGRGAWADAPAAPAPASGGLGPDLSEVRGQAMARLACEVAAAGGHHLLLLGPPGAGKTMLAHRLPGLLPDLDPAVAIEATRIHSAAGFPLGGGLVRRPPLRAPHHTSSTVSIIGGGGSWLRPGEISLAHGGVLFLDELGEFPVHLLEALRQPLEEGVVRVSRARGTVCFPARFQLVAATNPCPCGEGGPPGACACTDAARARYLRRLSGPLMDRFDLRVEVARPGVDALLAGGAAEPSPVVAARVAAARAAATARGVDCNADIPGHRLDRLAPLDAPARRLLHRALERGRLSARGLHRVRRVARTVADLSGEDAIGEAHAALALQLRSELGLLGRQVA